MGYETSKFKVKIQRSDDIIIEKIICAVNLAYATEKAKFLINDYYDFYGAAKGITHKILSICEVQNPSQAMTEDQVKALKKDLVDLMVKYDVRMGVEIDGDIEGITEQNFVAVENGTDNTIVLNHNGMSIDVSDLKDYG